MNGRLKSEKQKAVERGQWLVEWLNDAPERNGDKTRITTLLDHIARLQAVLTSSPDSEQEVNSEENCIYECLRPYKLRPVFHAAFSSPHEIDIGYEPLGKGTSEEWSAIEALQYLVQTGLVDRVCKCSQCKTRWIFRTRKDRQYCSSLCKQDRYEKSTKRRKRKKEYQKEYYHKFLSPKSARGGKRNGKR